MTNSTSRQPPKFKDITGQRFNYLTVVSRHSSQKGHASWRCRCDCGNETITTTGRLQSNNTKSCGCAKATHGHTRRYKMTPTYSSWRNMLARCFQPSNPAFTHYQKKGITVCERWQHSFENFLADMGERPSTRHSIDRWPNNDGDYEPGNCRWATKMEQANNRESNIHYNHEGKRYTLMELSRATGVPKDILRSRLRRSTWTVEQAVSIPVSRANKALGIYKNT